MGFRRSSWLLTPLLVSGLVLALGARVAVARDEFVDQLNALFAKVPKEKRSDLVILPVLAKMEPPPAEVSTLPKAQLIMTTSPGWEGAAKWAQGKTQQDVLKALTEITKEEDYHVAMVFAQGYGIDEVVDSPDLLAAKMYTDLGDPPTLAMARFAYIQKLEEAGMLVSVEATRLVAEGKPVEAIDALFHFMYFARQIADRPMLAEKKRGMQGIRGCLVRIRDIVYQDMQAEKHQLDYKSLRRYVEHLEEQKGYLGIDRIPPPVGTFIATDQVLHQVLIEKDGVNQETFAVVMARVASQGRPLRLFSESAYWESIRPLHEGWYATRDMLVGKDETGGLRNDWRKRWNIDPHDSYNRTPSDYKRYVVNGPRFAVLRALLDGVEDLFPLKTALRTEVVGTRMSLAVYGYMRGHHDTFPALLTSIRPDYISAIDIDPFSPARKPIEYFIPIKDNIPKQDPRRDPIPLRVTCYPGKPYKSFQIPLKDDTFVIFSVGPDEVSGLVKDATQEDTELEGDYLLWPPMISLIRKHLLDTGELK